VPVAEDAENRPEGIGGSARECETVKFQILDIRPWNNGTSVPKPKAEPNPLAAAQAVQIALSPAPSPAPAAETGSVLVKSTPDDADVSIDGQFMGNTPSRLNLPARRTHRLCEHIRLQDLAKKDCAHPR
jgi:hypothetical protein